ncbi:hypothetical protein, partial [Methylobacterium sp. A54F]
MADGSEKPIGEVRPGDLVMAFDGSADPGRGGLVPRPVTRTFRDTARHVVDLRGLHCTPGHVFLTGETDAHGRGVSKMISTILKEDGTIVLAQGGAVLRARTGAPVGPIDDSPIQ